MMVINETGSGGFIRTTQVNYTSNYIKLYLGPMYGFTVKIPPTQLDIDSVFRDDSLSTYDVIVFNGSTRIGGNGAIGDSGAQHAFERWMKHGGGLVGITGAMDHNDTWPWLRDSVYGGTKFTEHSTWGAASDASTKVQWDTLKTNGVLNSLKPEYDSLRACYPPLHTNFIYPDEWYSLTVNPRSSADILLTVDEATYTVPATGGMGPDHPVAWAYHLPPDADGNSGRFIYSERGHDLGAWDGTSANHAPIDSAAGAVTADGVVYSDTSHTLMTKGFFWQSIRWAAGLMQEPVSIRSLTSNAYGLPDARNENGVLKIRVNAVGKEIVQVFDLAGHRRGEQSGDGSREYSFANLRQSTVYLVRVKAGNQEFSRRILL
ncbi:MAG: ThuA domain-containing protein [Fibrobacteres bacterium]|nr:ThuA domain-containing protein [Fibrobacterota bacterium]